MSTAEKIQGLMIHTGEVKGLGLPAYNWWEEATHGVTPFADKSKNRDGTNFAYPITTGAAFNRSLWKATGRQIGREARAYMNAGKITIHSVTLKHVPVQ
jgi:beta-glucosidase-like glycosyl hydrolase